MIAEERMPQAMRLSTSVYSRRMQKIDPEWERRLAALWDSLDSSSGDAFVVQVEQLVAELPAHDPVGLFERACSLDSTGHSDLAVPLYRQALHRGLHGERRRRAVIQLASSLRNIGSAAESVSLLTEEQKRQSDHLDDGVSAFLALALVETGREREAVAIALTALSRHMTRYRRSVANYASHLVDGEPPTSPSNTTFPQ